MHDHSHTSHNGRGHAYDHSPHWIFKLGMLLNFSFLIADMIIWQISGSIAIFGDSLHNGFHGLAHTAALWGHGLEGNPEGHNREESFRSRKRKHQAMRVIGVLIVAGAILIAIFGSLQIKNPGNVQSTYMLITASLDIGSNIALALLLLRHRDDLTVRALFMDIAIDTLAAVGVIIGGIVIFFTNFYRADGIAALPIALIALWLGIQIICNAPSPLSLATQFTSNAYRRLRLILKAH